MKCESEAETYRALGYRFGVVLEGPDREFLATAVNWLFQGLRSSDDGIPEHLYRLTSARSDLVRLERDGVLLGEDLTDLVALSATAIDVNAQAVASRPEHLILHAGAVASAGTGLLLPAGSGAGKSTLTAGLVAAGCDYLTDEAASIDLGSLMLEPYAKPLSLSLGSQAVVGSNQSEHWPMELIPASSLRSGCWSGPVRPGRIVFPSFQRDAAAELTPVSRGEALVELANNSFNFVDHGGAWLRSLRDLVAGCDCWRLTFGNAVEAAALILERVL